MLVRVEADKYATLTKRFPDVKPAQAIKREELTLSPAKTIIGRVVNEKGVPFTQGWLRATHTASPEGEPNTQLLSGRIERDGTLNQFVPFGGRAWHAGVSRFEARERCNDFSIGWKRPTLSQ